MHARRARARSRAHDIMHTCSLAVLVRASPPPRLRDWLLQSHDSLTGSSSIPGPAHIFEDMPSEISFVDGAGFLSAVDNADKLFIVAPSAAFKDGTAFEGLRTSKIPLAVSRHSSMCT